MKRLIQMALVSLFPVMAFAQEPYDNSTISKFDLSRYLGTWYELARFDHKFERGMDNVTAELNIVACHVLPETAVVPSGLEQLDLFAEPEDTSGKEEQRRRERCRQRAVIDIRRRYGKNAILKGMNLEEGATARDRNRQIGGHKA